MARSESILLIVLLLAGCSPSGEPKNRRSACASEWRTVTGGIDYRAMNCEPDGDFDLHLVRIDPREARIGAVVERGGVQSVRDAAFAINANFFDENFRPLGVVISEGKSLNPLHPVEWQSVFYVKKNGETGIVPSGEWDSVKDAEAAFQAGPRLTVAGAPNKVSQATPVARSGVCVAGDHVIFFATPPNRSFDVHQMIELAVKLECRDSLLLDGGPSTQLYVNVPGGPITMQGDVNVPAYIVAK